MIIDSIPCGAPVGRARPRGASSEWFSGAQLHANALMLRDVIEDMNMCKFINNMYKTFAFFIAFTIAGSAWGQALEPVDVPAQPLAANVGRLIEALEMVGAPLAIETAAAVKQAGEAGDARGIQRVLDPHVLLVVELNPEERVKVQRGPARAVLQQAGFTPVVIKVINESTATKPLHVSSPQSGPIYAGVASLSMTRQGQMHLKDGETPGGGKGRFLQAEMFTGSPMTSNLSGLKAEYALALLSSSEAGPREATIGFDIGSGTQDLGFRGEVPILFDIRPAVVVRLHIRDHDGTPTTAHVTILDRAGHVYPTQPKRLAPDLFFQRQVYRHDGGTVLLPPGKLRVVYGRGPEYRRMSRDIVIPDRGATDLDLRLERWIDPKAYGYYVGDHHIHAAGCAHYTDPTQGVRPEDMFLQVKGEGLNVGCILTWGPCFDYQRRFFSGAADRLSEPFTVLKYDIEVSGFGSQALGHVCLLNLRDQVYPGSHGTEGWPTWTTPVLRWAKAQGAVTGYAHSASGLEVNPKAAAARLLSALDSDKDSALSRPEAASGLLPEDFAAIDTDQDGSLTRAELEASHDRAADALPNEAIPEMNGVGAQEIVVTATMGLCDFISAMDTPRVAEWNCWYHLLNCGLPIKVSGETDFPCMSGTRVGQGRVYVHLEDVRAIDFGEWCAGVARGRSYVSDGYAHALEFAVNGQPAGSTLRLDRGATVDVHAKVAFAAQTPRDTAYGPIAPAQPRRLVGDTVTLHGPRREGEFLAGGSLRRVELVVNGRAVDHRDVPADDAVHELTFRLPLERSSWVAVRQFPQMHTNPVEVRVGGRPIRASRRSALWCLGAVEQLWRARGAQIALKERAEAKKAFDQAVAWYRNAAGEASEQE